MTPLFQTDDDRWAAAHARDKAADGHFICCVRTTGIYCRPSCAGRPLRKNVFYVATVEAARLSGMRACKRCRPDGPYGAAA